MRTHQANLVITPDDISWTPLRLEGDEVVARVAVRVRNTGMTESSGPTKVRLEVNLNGIDWARPFALREAAEPKVIPPLSADDSYTATWEEVRFPLYEGGLTTITAEADSVTDEFDLESNRATRWHWVPTP